MECEVLRDNIILGGFMFWKRGFKKCVLGQFGSRIKVGELSFYGIRVRIYFYLKDK